MRPSLAAAMAVVIVATAASASDIVVTDLTPGTTIYLKVTLSASGTATVSQIPSVTVGGTTTPTDPIITPTDPGLSGLAQTAYTRAVQIAQPTEASTLGATYAAIAAELRNGNLAAADAADRTTEAVDTVLGVMRAKARWQPWRDAVSAEMRTMGIRTGDDLAAAYESLSEGLAAASGNAKVDFAVIIKLVLAVISKNPSAIAEAVLALVQSLRG